MLLITLLGTIIGVVLWSTRDTPEPIAPVPEPVAQERALTWQRIWKIVNPLTNGDHRIAVITVGDTAIEVTEENIPALTELLAHENRSTRRWAGQALEQLHARPQ